MKYTKNIYISLSLLFIVTHVCAEQTPMRSGGFGKGPVQVSLFRAAQEGSIELIKAAVQRKEDVNGKDSQGNTPLHYAIQSGNFDAVQELVRDGAFIDANLISEAEKKNPHMAFYLILEAKQMN